MVVTLACGRIARLRPYGRRIGLVMMVVYIGAAFAFVVWNAVSGGV